MICKFFADPFFPACGDVGKESVLREPPEPRPEKDFRQIHPGHGGDEHDRLLGNWPEGREEDRPEAVVVDPVLDLDPAGGFEEIRAEHPRDERISVLMRGDREGDRAKSGRGRDKGRGHQPAPGAHDRRRHDHAFGGQDHDEKVDEREKANKGEEPGPLRVTLQKVDEAFQVRIRGSVTRLDRDIS